MEVKWITMATFSDGSLYQYRWFRDAGGCGLEYRKHSPNTERHTRRESEKEKP